MNRCKIVLVLSCLVILTLAAAGAAQAGTHRLGGGLHFQRNLGDIEDYGFDANSFSILGSYQYDGGLLKLEGDVDYIFDYAGTDEAMWEPSAWVLLGDMIYGGGGIGIGYINSEWQSDPFYALRAGVDIKLSSFDLDVFGTYRFQSDQDFEDLTGEDLDSVTFAALLRFAL